MRRGLVCKRLRDYEPKHSECLCSELTFTNKKWSCFSIYRLPESSNPSMFFEELTISLSKTILKYENLLITGDCSRDVKSKSLGRNLDIEKASGIDTIPPKLIKLSTNFLTLLLTKAINTSITQNAFPGNAKIASVIPFDKGKPNMNEISNFRPVIVLNTFSKSYQRPNSLWRGKIFFTVFICV